MMINTLIKTGLGVALATLLSFSAYADDTSSQTNTDSGRMSAGGGVQPADQYSDGACKGDECPDEGLQEDNAATDIPDDNTDDSDDAY